MPWITIGPRNEYETLVDDDDMHNVMQHKWYYHKNKHGVFCTAKPHVLLTHYLLKPPSGMVVDHIDRDVLNNSRSNLRACTQGDNARNIAKHTVRMDPSGRWRARVKHNGEHIHLGMYDTKEEALAVVIEKKRELFGEYAPT